jgi:hypothetical protein
MWYIINKQDNKRDNVVTKKRKEGVWAPSFLLSILPLGLV